MSDDHDSVPGQAPTVHPERAPSGRETATQTRPAARPRRPYPVDDPRASGLDRPGAEPDVVSGGGRDGGVEPDVLPTGGRPALPGTTF